MLYFKITKMPCVTSVKIIISYASLSNNNTLSSGYSEIVTVAN